MNTNLMQTKSNRLSWILGGIAIVGALALFALKGHSAEPPDALPPLSEVDYGKVPGMVDEPAEKLFGAGRVFLGSAGTFRLKDVAETSAITGAGGLALQGGYHVVDNVAIVAEGATENWNHSVFDSASAGLQLYIPIKDTGLAPYGKLLGGRQFEGEENWTIAGEVGLELRGKRFGGFLGVRYDYDLEEQSAITLVIGGNIHFGTR